MNGNRKFAALVSAAGICFSLGAAAADYQLIDKFRIGGEGGWDYLTYDTAATRLFIARENRVQIVDPETGTVLGEIADTPGVTLHG